MPLFILAVALATGLIASSLGGDLLVVASLLVAAAAVVWAATSVPKVVQRPLSLLAGHLAGPVAVEDRAEGGAAPDGEPEAVDPEEVAQLLSRTDEVGVLANAIVAQVDHAEALAHRNADLATDLSVAVGGTTRRSLVHLLRLLEEIDAVVDAEEDPARRDRLREIGHLAGLLRRQHEGLLVVADEVPVVDHDAAPAPIVDLVQRAAGETEDPDRVRLDVATSASIVGWAGRPLVQMVAALLDNGLRYSPPESRVVVATQSGSQGTVVRIRDHGLGMGVEEMVVANRTLAEPPLFGAEQSRHLGLYVCAVVAQRIGATVELRQAADGEGVEALVHLPAALHAGHAGTAAAPPRVDRATRVRAMVRREGVTARPAPTTGTPTPDAPTPHVPALDAPSSDVPSSDVPTADASTADAGAQGPVSRRRRRWRDRDRTAAPSGWSVAMPGAAAVPSMATPPPAAAAPEAAVSAEAAASAEAGAVPPAATVPPTGDVPGPGRAHAAPAAAGTGPAGPASSTSPTVPSTSVGSPAPAVPVQAGAQAPAGDASPLPRRTVGAPVSRDRGSDGQAAGTPVTEDPVAQASAVLEGLAGGAPAGSREEPRPSATLLRRLFAEQPSGEPLVGARHDQS